MVFPNRSNKQKLITATSSSVGDCSHKCKHANRGNKVSLSATKGTGNILQPAAPAKVASYCVLVVSARMRFEFCNR